MTEYDEQKWLFDEFLPWFQNIHPDAALCFAVPNGQYRPGQRPEPGLKSGVPDICCPVARGGYLGLWIELKYGRNKPSTAQEEWIRDLRLAGHRVEVCWERDEAVSVLQQYFGWENTEFIR